MASTEITFDKLVYVDRLKSAGVDEPQARAHAEALDQALRDTVATKQDLREEIRNLRDEMRSEIARLDHKIDVAVRDITIRMGGIAIVLFGALASIKFFG
jgi:cell division protein FtsB